jgi:hypothetical protein
MHDQETQQIPVAELATFDSDIAQRVTAVLHRQEMLLVDLIREGQK